MNKNTLWQGLGTGRTSLMQLMIRRGGVDRRRFLRRIWNESFAHLTVLQILNRLLLGGTGLCVFVIGVNFVRPLWTEIPQPVPAAMLRSVKTDKAHAVQLADLTERNLFRPLIAPAPPPPKVVVLPPTPQLPPPPPKIPLSQRMSHFKLVGIANATPPQAIIEDASSQKTLYVSTGQALDDAVVEKITSDRVTVISGDERYDLTL